VAITKITNPKSYLLDEQEREALLREGGMNLVCLVESQEAGKAGDEDTAWAWLSKAELASYSLKRLKKNYGAAFIREMGFNTRKADEAYGADWLDRE